VSVVQFPGLSISYWIFSIGSANLARNRQPTNCDQVSGIEHWDAGKVIAAIKHLANSRLPLNATYIERHYTTLFHVAVNRFPRSWAKALQAAGLDPAEHKKLRGRWTWPKAEQWVKQRVAKRKSILARDTPKDLLDFVRHRDQNCTGYAESLGISYPGVKKRRDWTKAKLLEEMRQWKKEGHPMHYNGVQRVYQALIQLARNYYGSWDRARAAAKV
jgi:hypothetical protein